MESKINEDINRLELIDADIVLYLKKLIEEVYKQSICWQALTINLIHELCDICFYKSLLFSGCISRSYTNKVVLYSGTLCLKI